MPETAAVLVAVSEEMLEEPTRNEGICREEEALAEERVVVLATGA